MTSGVFKVNTLSVNVLHQVSVRWDETLSTLLFGWCCFVTVLPGAALNMQVYWLLRIFSSGRSPLWSVRLWIHLHNQALALLYVSQGCRLTDWQTESWTDRHELCHHGYHSCCRLPPICSWRWGVTFICPSVRGVQGWLQVNACHFVCLFL